MRINSIAKSFIDPSSAEMVVHVDFTDGIIEAFIQFPIPEDWDTTMTRADKIAAAKVVVLESIANTTYTLVDELIIFPDTLESSEAVAAYLNLPSWALLDGEAAEVAVHNMIFGGATLAAKQAEVNALPNTFPAMKGMGNALLAELKAVRDLLEKMVKAQAYMRDINIPK